MLIAVAKFSDFLLGEKGRRKVKDELVSIYVLLDWAPHLRSVFLSIFSVVSSFFHHISWPESSSSVRIFRLFLVCAFINTLFFGYIYQLLQSQTWGIYNSPNLSQHSYVPYWILIILSAAPIFIQSSLDVTSALATYKISMYASKHRNILFLIIIHAVLVAILYIVNSSFIVWLTQNISSAAWSCFGVIYTSWGSDNSYTYNSCSNLSDLNNGRTESFLSIIRHVLTLNFSFKWAEGGDEYPVSHSGLALMSLTVAWPIIIYFMLILASALGILFYRLFRVPAMIVVNRLEEDKEGVFTKIAYGISAALTLTVVAIRLIGPST